MVMYRKKPVVIEAVQWAGVPTPELDDFIEKGQYFSIQGTTLIVPTLEGEMKANKGDYIIKGVQGEYYPCKPDIFEQTYEEVVEE